MTAAEVFKLDPEDTKFYGHMGIEEIYEEGEYVITKMPVAHCLINSMGNCQGGALYSLCDIAAAAFVRLKHKPSVTVDSDIRFYRPAKEGDVLTARAGARKLGKHISYVLVEVFDGEGKLCADSNATLFFKD